MTSYPQHGTSYFKFNGTEFLRYQWDAPRGLWLHSSEFQDLEDKSWEVSDPSEWQRKYEAAMNAHPNVIWDPIYDVDFDNE